MVSHLPFKWSVRIYFEDTDSGGVVYHSNYLKFMERARTEWLRSLHLNQVDLKKKDKIMFVVANVNINYKKAGRFNDELDIETSIDKIGASRVDSTLETTGLVAGDTTSFDLTVTELVINAHDSLGWSLPEF